MKIDISVLKNNPDYSGSVQKLYFIDNENILCETTTGGSVFDVGTIFYIPESDKYRTAIRHLIYSGLNQKKDFSRVFDFIEANQKLKKVFNENILKKIEKYGVKTHHIGVVDRKTGNVFETDLPENLTNLTLVKRFSIYKPKKLMLKHQVLWDYHLYHLKDNYVIPLENIIRFGITPESSVYKRYKKGDNSVLYQLGVEELYPWQIFDVPVIDFTTKYEPQDRAVTYQEALNISGISGEKFEELFNLTLFCGIYIYLFFKEANLTLWDLKLEFAISGDDIILVDTVDTDSVRVTYKIDENFIHFNKQAVRDYYRKFHKDWVDAIEEAKRKSKKTGIPFQEILKEKFPIPPEIDEEFLKIQSEKLKTLINVLTSKANKKQLELIAKKEFDFKI